MATRLTDLISNVVRTTSINTTAATTGSTIGSSVDMINGENPVTMYVHCFSPLGALSYQLKVQESTDGTTWADITGASIAAATTTGTSAVQFNRSLRYLAGYSTVASSTTGALLVQFFAPLKQNP